MRYQTILFDMDGTLVDTSVGVLDCFAHTMRAFGLPAMEREQMLIFMGPPLSYSFSHYCGLTGEDVRKAIEIYRERYETKGQYACTLFPQMEALLQELTERRYRLCVATSKLERYAVAIANRLGIARYFEEIVGSDPEETISAKDEVIEEALRRLQITDRKSVLMIGDRKQDVLGAKACGLDSFGVYMGCAEPNEHERAGATYIAHGIPELREQLLKL